MLLNHTSPKSHHQNQNIKRDRKRNPSFTSTEPIVEIYVENIRAKSMFLATSERDTLGFGRS